MTTKTVVTDGKLLREGLSALQRILRLTLVNSSIRTIGYPSGSVNKRTHFSPDYAIWHSHWRSDNPPKYVVNAFGHRAFLRQTISNTIVFQLNIPPNGLNRKLAGVILQDTRNKSLWLGHRGRVGGGAEGVGKASFKNWYRDGHWEVVNDAGIESDILVLGPLSNSRRILHGLETMLDAVTQFKTDMKELRDNKSQEPAAHTKKLRHPLTFNPESTGETTVSGKKGYKMSRTHGNIVQALKDFLETDPEVKELGNPDDMDLLALKPNGYHLYEIKTQATTQPVFTGIGQLYGYGLRFEPVKKYLVIPRKHAARWATDLKKIGIFVIGFEYDGVAVKFHHAAT